MDTIIQEIINKIMENSRTNLEVAFTGGRPISEFMQSQSHPMRVRGMKQYHGYTKEPGKGKHKQTLWFEVLAFPDASMT